MAASESSCVGELAAALAAQLGAAPDVAVVLGSGWRERATGLLAESQILATDALPGWPQPRVAGHAADLVLGTRASNGAARRVLLVGGRVHAYEGHPARVLVRGVRALARWGVPNLVLLNAAGSLREALGPGALVVLRDHINAGLPNPLVGSETEDGTAPFLNLVDLYEPAWRARLLAAVAADEGLAGASVVEGVYTGVLGPSYETPAEVRAFAASGGDAVGMSTIHEAIAARAAGMRVLAMSMITNHAAGIAGSQPSHEEVLETAAEHGAAAAAVLAAAIDHCTEAGVRT